MFLQKRTDMNEYLSARNMHIIIIVVSLQIIHIIQYVNISHQKLEKTLEDIK